MIQFRKRKILSNFQEFHGHTEWSLLSTQLISSHFDFDTFSKGRTIAHVNVCRILRIVGGVTITFELMSDCAHTLPSIYDLNFLTTCLTALHFLPSLFHAAFHSSNLSPLMRLFHRLLFSCVWDPSSLCISFASC